MRLNRILQVCLGAALVSLATVVALTIREPLVEAGDAAPKFSIVTASGKTMTQSDFGGKVLVLNFWATWCPPCVQEMPSLNEMAQRLAPEGVVVLGVSVDKSENAYQRFVRQFGVDFPTARDPEGKISSSFGTFKYPETYVIDASGRVRYKYVNERNWVDEAIVREIRSAL